MAMVREKKSRAFDVYKFIDAWQSWDEQPGDKARADRFEAWCGELGNYLLVSRRVIRRDLAEEFRGCGNRMQALERVAEKWRI